MKLTITRLKKLIREEMDTFDGTPPLSYSDKKFYSSAEERDDDLSRPRNLEYHEIFVSLKNDLEDLITEYIKREKEHKASYSFMKIFQGTIEGAGVNAFHRLADMSAQRKRAKNDPSGGATPYLAPDYTDLKKATDKLLASAKSSPYYKITSMFVKAVMDARSAKFSEDF